MTEAIDENTLPGSVAFCDSRWKMRWVIVGLVVLLLWRIAVFVDRQWFAQLPLWLLYIFTILAPQAFFLIFPIITRIPHQPSTSHLSVQSRWKTELGIAIPAVIGTLVVLSAVNYLIGLISPGVSRVPDTIRNAAESPNQAFVFLTIVLAFSLVPIAEELFFRGFLYNAFRARMPIPIAALLESLFFGLGHYYGAMPIGVAFVLGLLLTAVYEWRKTLITPILVHAGITFLAALGTVAMMMTHANSPMIGVVGDPKDTQCVIRQISPGSAAEEAGLQVGDIITSFNNEPIRDYSHLVETVPLYQPGDAIPVRIKRSGSEFEVTVVLRRRGGPYFVAYVRAANGIKQLPEAQDPHSNQEQRPPR